LRGLRTIVRDTLRRKVGRRPRSQTRPSGLGFAPLAWASPGGKARSAKGAHMSEIVFDGVTRVFIRDGKGFPTLDGIDLTIREKEFVAIVGPSGCGKTTCLRMVAGLEFPSTGTVKVGGAAVTAPGPQRAVVFLRAQVQRSCRSRARAAHPALHRADVAARL